MKKLSTYLFENNLINEDTLDDWLKSVETSDYDTENDSTRESINFALLGDIRTYAEADIDFVDRKIAIVKAFKIKLLEAQKTVEHIEKTKIFNYFIIHLIKAYKENVDEEVKVNVSTENELRHTIATEMLLMVKDVPF